MKRLMVYALLVAAHKARVLRNIGIVAAVLGTALTIAGGVLISQYPCCDADDRRGVWTGFGPLGGSLLALGQVAAVAGVTMWTVGQGRLQRAEGAKLSVSLNGAQLTF